MTVRQSKEGKKNYPPGLIWCRRVVSVEQAAGVKKTEEGSEIRDKLLILINIRKRGSPTDPDVYWISESSGQLASAFNQESGLKVSDGVIKRLLKELGYCSRKPSKVISTGTYAGRDAQFKIIIGILAFMSLSQDQPLVSIDCKKKERLGNLSRGGQCLCTGFRRVMDHDYEHLSQGKVIPHGIYDLHSKTGYITVGVSSETAEFIFDNLMWWWTQYGIHRYPDAESILILCDAGGANSYRHHVFKYWMIRFAQQTGVCLVICHYPPYASKWNPIEHRLFAHVHRASSGVVFDSYQTVVQTIGKTSTQTGVKVIVRLNTKEYQTGLKMSKERIDKTKIRPHPQIPDLNYRIIA